MAARYWKRAPANGSSRHGTRVRVLAAAAALHPQQLGRALVELVVADRGEAEPEQVHRVDRRLVEEIGRGERRGADQVAGGDGDRVGMALPRACSSAAASCAAPPTRAFSMRAVGLRDRRPARRRFDIAVEIVDREDLHLDRRGRRVREGGADLRRASRQATGPRTRPASLRIIVLDAPEAAAARRRWR